MTPNRWLACGCCHLDGGNLSDNLVWEFTENQKPSSPRLVNTKPLSITGWSAPPILIQGTYRSVQEEEKLIRSFLGGSGFLREKGTPLSAELAGKARELDGLAAFILRLKPRLSPHMDGTLPRMEILDSVRRGRRLFTSSRVGCNRCHRGSNLTISALNCSTVGRTPKIVCGYKSATHVVAKNERNKRMATVKRITKCFMFASVTN